MAFDYVPYVQPVLEVVLTAVVVPLAIKAIKWLGAKEETLLAEHHSDTVMMTADMLIRAAIQKLPDKPKVERYAWVMNELKQYFPTEDTSVLDAALEAAVFNLKQEFGAQPADYSPNITAVVDQHDVVAVPAVPVVVPIAGQPVAG